MSHQLFAGVSNADITPPYEVGLLTSSLKETYEPFTSTRRLLKARILALKASDTIIAIVSLDLLGLTDTSVNGWMDFKNSIAGPLSPENIIITCTHAHTAPESVGLTDLYLTGSYQKWLMLLKSEIRKAIYIAVNDIRPCTFSTDSTILKNFSLQRRIPSENGILLSDAVQPIADELMERGPVDHRVRILRFYDLSGKTISTVVHAICHPVNEMCIPEISADYPGEMCLTLESLQNQGFPIYWNGAAGDINPPTVSSGSDAAINHGRALAEAVYNVRSHIMPGDTSLKFRHSENKLSFRKGYALSNVMDAVMRINVISIGSCAIVFLPGEPFVDIALEIEKKSPFTCTIVVGYSENSVGYIPTGKALMEGGYEIGPAKWSFLEEKADELIVKMSLSLLQSIKV